MRFQRALSDLVKILHTEDIPTHTSSNSRKNITATLMYIFSTTCLNYLPINRFFMQIQTKNKNYNSLFIFYLLANYCKINKEIVTKKIRGWSKNNQIQIVKNMFVGFLL